MDFLWLKKAVVNGYCQNKETRGKIRKSQSLKALLYFHSQYNFPKYASKLITMQLHIQVLHTEARAKQFIISVHYCLHGIFGKFHGTENVSKSSNSHAGMLLGLIHLFLCISELHSQHWAFAVPVKLKSDPVNTNAVATYPKYGAFSQKKIL